MKIAPNLKGVAVEKYGIAQETLQNTTFYSIITVII